jgi:hypothetical protein
VAPASRKDESPGKEHPVFGGVYYKEGRGMLIEPNTRERERARERESARERERERERKSGKAKETQRERASKRI